MLNKTLSAGDCIVDCAVIFLIVAVVCLHVANQLSELDIFQRWCAMAMTALLDLYFLLVLHVLTPAQKPY